MGDLPTNEDAARRVRAALAFADIDVKDSAEKVGIHDATMARIVARSKPRGLRNETEMSKIADATGVPISFLQHGFPLESPSTLERLEALEGQMAAVLKRYAGDAPPAPPGAGQRPLSSVRNSESSQEPPSIQEAPDGRSNTER